MSGNNFLCFGNGKLSAKDQIFIGSLISQINDSLMNHLCKIKTMQEKYEK